MQLQLNGQDHSTSATTVAELLSEQGIDPVTATGVAVALNQSVVLRASWDEQPLAEGDSVELITAMAGG